MGPLLVVFSDPRIKVGLQLVDRALDSIRLRALGLGAAVIDVLNREIEFVFMTLGAAKLGAAIG